MNRAIATFADELTKRRAYEWGENRDFDVAEQIFMLIEDKFGAHWVTVVDVQVLRTVLAFTVTSDAWPGGRQFVLTPDGGLVWG